MARTKVVEINGVDYTLQSVSYEWYLDLNDRHGLSGGGRRKTSAYVDELLKNCVVTPGEIKTRGIKCFDDDIATGVALTSAIETFLSERKQPGDSPANGKG